MVKILPAVRETGVWSMDWEDLLEKEMASYSSILAWRIPWTTAFSNLLKLWAIPHRATQDGHVMVERSDKMWSTGEGNGKPLQYSCLENPMNSTKKQNDTILKEELPRSVGAQYATGDQWRNNSRKNEGMGPNKNNTQLWMWLVIEARSNAVKRNIA